MFNFFESTTFTILSTLVVLALLPPAAQAESVELVPGVLLDQERATMYLMAPGGGVEAVDTGSGRVQWTTDKADKPLAVSRDRVYAQAQGLHPRELVIASLDRASGTGRDTMRVPVPDSVFVSVDDVLRSRFDVWAREDRGQLELGWAHDPQRTSPLPPKPNESRPAKLGGGARLSLETGSYLDLAVAPPRPEAPLAWAARDTGEHVITSIGANPVALIADHERLVLRRDGTSGIDTLLYAGPYHLRLLSADRRHLLVSRTDTSGSGYIYEVFSLVTGRRLGEVTARRSHAQFVVVGDLVIVEEPTYAVRVNHEMVRHARHVRAVDLNHGRERWQRPIRDTQYRGPRPH